MGEGGVRPDELTGAGTRGLEGWRHGTVADYAE